jgi:hypothetical protein
MSKDGVTCSLQIIVDEMKKGNFAHLTEEKNLFPRDGQEVDAMLGLVSPLTSAGLRALPAANVGARLLADIFEHIWNMFQAFDVKRTDPAKANPNGLPVLSRQQRLDMLEAANDFLQQVLACAIFS